jgi:CheY-like chemotaxis protein
MGGDIAVESAAGEGTVFTVTLPAQVRAAAPEEVEAAAATEELPTTGEAGTLLVIDDDPEARNLMRRFFSKEGYRVEEAADGESGLARARELGPDVITLDVMMPGMDGWAVLSALKADPELADIPVVMLSIVDERNLGFALGASEYMTKPIDRERLAAVLRKYASRDRARRVLLVEDDGATRAMLRRVLEREAWEVEEAENGRVALERMAVAEPALILLDLMMPEMDGFEFLEALRERRAGPAIPIVVLTAKDLTEEERRRLNGGVERIVQKAHYTRDALLAEVRQLVSARAKHLNT